MSDLFLTSLPEADTDFEGFYDGKQEILPDGTIFDVVVVDAFNGIQEGKAVMSCFISLQVVTPGPYLGYKYRYNAKVYDVDAAKRDRALKNLQLLDTQAGSPLATIKDSNGNRLPLTTENMQEHWVGAAFARVKLGYIPINPEEPGSKENNYVSGFGYLREKLPQQQATQQTAHQPSQQEAQQPAPEDDVGF